MSAQLTSELSPMLVNPVLVSPMLEPFLQALEGVEGISAFVLGGSRARGTATATSDYDLGLYYESHHPLNVTHLQAVVSPFVDEPETALVTPVGEWGPWINGGGWLTVGGQKVDLLYRDLGRVEAVVAQCLEGHISMEYQPGHPHGFCSAIWMGEVALCHPFFDPQQRAARLKEQTTPFSPQGSHPHPLSLGSRLQHLQRPGHHRAWRPKPHRRVCLQNFLLYCPSALCAQRQIPHQRERGLGRSQHLCTHH
jgi:predicted nucleotidyltransferase